MTNDPEKNDIEDQDALARAPEAPPKDEEKTRAKARVARLVGQAKIAELNRKHFVVNNIGGKCLIGEFIPSSIDPNCRILSLQAPAPFATRYGNQKVGIFNGDDDSTTYQELGRYWLKHRDRLSYEGIELVPDGPLVLPGNRLNLWRGWGVEPKQGEYPLIKSHLAKILANGDPLAERYNWNWAAWAVQNPGLPAEVALAFRGLKGTGKGLWGHAVRTIFGQHGLYISSPGHLIGQFNGHLESCVFLFADEAFAVDDKKSESVLKALVTEPVMMVERKGIDARQVKNLLHVMMAANQDWVVPATGDERRFVVNEVSDARRGDKNYFDALFAERDNGGLEALFYDLLHTDLGEWHPRQIYETKALREQKRYSLSGEDEWLEAVLQDGAIPGHEPTNPRRATSQAMMSDAARRFPRLRYTSETAFGRFLGNNGCWKWRTAGARGWEFPPLSAARSKWEARFGGWEWEEVLEDWQ